MDTDWFKSPESMALLALGSASEITDTQTVERLLTARILVVIAPGLAESASNVKRSQPDDAILRRGIHSHPSTARDRVCEIKAVRKLLQSLVDRRTVVS